MKTRDAVQGLVREYAYSAISGTEENQLAVGRAQKLVNDLVAEKNLTPLQTAAKVARLAEKFAHASSELGGNHAAAKQFAEQVGITFADTFDTVAVASAQLRPSATGLLPAPPHTIAARSGSAARTHSLSRGEGACSRRSSRGTSDASAASSLRTDPFAGPSGKRRKTLVRLSAEQKARILESYRTDDVSKRQLARTYNVDDSTVGRIIKNASE